MISVIASLSKSLGRYLDDSLAIQPRLLEAHYNQARPRLQPLEAVSAMRSVSRPLRLVPMTTQRSALSWLSFGVLIITSLVEPDHSVNEALLVETREGEVAKPWYRLSPHLFGIICPEYLLGQVVLQHTGGLPNAGVDGGHCGKSSAATTRLLVLD